MISDFFTTLYVVKRSAWSTDEEGNPYSGEVEVGSFMGHIQDAQAELVASLGLTLTKMFTIWCPVSSSVLAGDTLESIQGIYSVKAIRTFNIGDNKHLEIVVQLDEVTGS